MQAFRDHLSPERLALRAATRDDSDHPRRSSNHPNYSRGATTRLFRILQAHLRSRPCQTGDISPSDSKLIALFAQSGAALCSSDAQILPLRRSSIPSSLRGLIPSRPDVTIPPANGRHVLHRFGAMGRINLRDMPQRSLKGT